MNTQLKEKMQQAAAGYVDDNFYRHTVWAMETEGAFNAGASAMYSELAPLVEWVSVEDRLPEKQGHYLVKVEYSFPKNCKVVIAEFDEDNNTFYSERSDSPIEDVTYWRRIDL